MDAIDALKQKVLTLAIQGKLVPQNPNDEPASELLKKIKAEKAELVKQGKIKKDKQESYIYKGADNTYYEKNGLETKDITEEIPFEIPENWEWVRLSSLCRLDNGEKVFNVKLPLLDAKYLRGKSSETIMDTGILVNKDDYIILVDGENSGEVFKAPICGIMGTTFKKLYITTNIYNEYILYLLKYYQKMFRNSKRGAAIPHLDKHLFANLMVGLPPLSEQERIVREIEKIFAEIEVVKENQAELSKLKDGLKSKILDLAIQGKLVEQDPNDEPASVLLEKIRAEKQELIKQGKIKKDKQESYIYKGADNRHYEKIGSETKDITDEIPFEIPESWSWCRLGSVGITQTGTTPATSHSEYFGKDIPFIKPADISNLSINYHNEGLSFEGIKYARLIKAKSILMVCIGGSIGKCYVNNCDVCCNQQINTFTPILSDFLYFLYLMQSDYFYKTTIFNATGTATPIINKSDWGNIIIPLPPLSEQLRIVEKLKNILKTIELL